jgi:hypothetical protein
MADDTQDKFDDLSRSANEDDGEPVDYDPFPEDTIADAMKAIERLARTCVSNTDRLSAALNKQAQALNELAKSIRARREVVRDENGKITATRVVH